jgi:hypothetical protein
MLCGRPVHALRWWTGGHCVTIYTSSNTKAELAMVHEHVTHQLLECSKIPCTSPGARSAGKKIKESIVLPSPVPMHTSMSCNPAESLIFLNE